MSKTRIYIAKFVALIVAMQILNLSIDQQNFHPEQPKYTLCYINEMNSVVELVTEKVITHRDTFPEDKNQNTNTPQVHKFAQIGIYFPSEKPTLTPHFTSFIKHQSFFALKYYSVSLGIQSPPPKYC